jgi:molybdate transport system ATP-binding protein
MPGDATLAIDVRVAGSSAGKPRLEVALVAPPGITAVMGASGAGKSTLLATVAGLVPLERGRIALGDEVLADTSRGVLLPPHRRRVALVFQSLALFPHLRAWENVAYGLRGGARGERRARALAWLERTHVGHLVDRQPSTLSGGEAQRVALARALASEPRALLLDEPFSALDSGLRAELGAELAALVSELRMPALFVTHDERDARLASRVLELDGGRLRNPR